MMVAMLAGHTIVSVDDVANCVWPVGHVKVRSFKNGVHFGFDNTDKMFDFAVVVLMPRSAELLSGMLAEAELRERGGFEYGVGVGPELGGILHGNLVSFAIIDKIGLFEIKSVGVNAADNAIRENFSLGGGHDLLKFRQSFSFRGHGADPGLSSVIVNDDESELIDSRCFEGWSKFADYIATPSVVSNGYRCGSKIGCRCLGDAGE
jgi:hypothetical protein